MPPRRLRADVQRKDSCAVIGIRVRAPLIRTDIVQPGGHVIAFDPNIGISQITEQRPMAGAVPAPDAAWLAHRVQELDDIRAGDSLLDRDGDRPVERLHRRSGFRLGSQTEGRAREFYYLRRKTEKRRVGKACGRGLKY